MTTSRSDDGAATSDAPGGPVGDPVSDPTSVEVAGERVALPVRVRSAAQVSATWLVDADAAQQIVAPTGLRVARQGRRGRASCSIAAVQYADNDLGPYLEVAVAFVVEPHDAPAGTRSDPRRPVTYIHRLPVNAAFTCAAGREIWGFPKWITDITWRRDRSGTDAVLVDEGRFVLGLHVGPGWVPLPARPLEMTCYSNADGVLRRTPWTTVSHGARLRPGGATLSLGEGHPMADELASLGLVDARPLLSMSVTAMEATFGAAEVVGDPLVALS